MIDKKNVPPIELTETVARYLFNKRNIREDNSIKPDEFIAYRYTEHSVNRHRDCSEAEIWHFGKQVADERGKILLGRTDISVEDCTIDTLNVVAKPIPGNPNHADITGYPPKKADQKALALKLAAKSSDLIVAPA